MLTCVALLGASVGRGLVPCLSLPGAGLLVVGRNGGYMTHFAFLDMSLEAFFP
jgi:hypothetical protein